MLRGPGVLAVVCLGLVSLMFWGCGWVHHRLMTEHAAVIVIPSAEDESWINYQYFFTHPLPEQFYMCSIPHTRNFHNYL